MLAPQPVRAWKRMNEKSMMMIGRRWMTVMRMMISAFH